MLLLNASDNIGRDKNLDFLRVFIRVCIVDLSTTNTADPRLRFVVKTTDIWRVTSRVIIIIISYILSKSAHESPFL
jgi:hypothetical protein